MQTAMNNMDKKINNAEEKISDTANQIGSSSWTGKTQIDRGINTLKSLAADTDIGAVASDWTNRVRNVSGDAFRDSIGFVKRYPVGAALGMAAVGFLLGSLSARSRRH